MHAIGNYIAMGSNKKVLFVNCSDFTEEYSNLFRERSKPDAIEQFKNKYENIDVLIIDDIQFLEVVKKTQNEFFQTFNKLYNNNKQIILASDRSPNDFINIESRLVTRFVSGLSLEIQPPDIDLRINLIKQTIKVNNYIDFPEDVIELIASICVTDVRTLHGNINKVMAFAAMENDNITMELASNALADFNGKPAISRNKITQVQQIVASKYNITLEQIVGKQRIANIANARHIAMYICKEYLNENYAKIGNEFGGRDHSTAMHGIEKIKKQIKKNKQLNDEIQILINKIR